MSLLTQADLDFFEDKGYVIARGVVPKPDCDAVIDAIWEFLGMDRNNQEDWYRPPLTHGGMTEMYQHQALWNTRQSPQVHQIFSQLFHNDKLCVTIDRVGMKPPPHPDHLEYEHKGFTHWDVDTSKLPMPFGVQGVLCLADTTADMGGFQCIPGFHQGLEEWIKTQPSDRNPRSPDLNSLPPGMKITPVPGNAGDLIIWINTLAHGNGHNVSKSIRFSQYISMFPADRLSEEAREHRINCWQRRLPPGGSIFPGDSREIEQTGQKTALLTPLGRKLLGLDPWQ